MNVNGQTRRSGRDGSGSRPILDGHPRHRRHDAGRLLPFGRLRCRRAPEHYRRRRQDRPADRRYAERFLLKGGWLDSRGSTSAEPQADRADQASLVEAFPSRIASGVWVNWGVRKDLLNISPSLRHAHNPRGDEPGSPAGARDALGGHQPGSWGAEVVDEINPGSRTFRSSSIASARFGTPRPTRFCATRVKTLFIGGVNMDQCVMTTLEDASFLGYDTILIEDATATTSPDFCVQAVLYNVKLLFGFVTRSAAILKSLSR